MTVVTPTPFCKFISLPNSLRLKTLVNSWMICHVTDFSLIDIAGGGQKSQLSTT